MPNWKWDRRKSAFKYCSCGSPSCFCSAGVPRRPDTGALEGRGRRTATGASAAVAEAGRADSGFPPASPEAPAGAATAESLSCKWAEATAGAAATAPKRAPAAAADDSTTTACSEAAAATAARVAAANRPRPPPLAGGFSKADDFLAAAAAAAPADSAPSAERADTAPGVVGAASADRADTVPGAGVAMCSPASTTGTGGAASALVGRPLAGAIGARPLLGALAGRGGREPSPAADLEEASCWRPGLFAGVTEVRSIPARCKQGVPT